MSDPVHSGIYSRYVSGQPRHTTRERDSVTMAKSNYAQIKVTCTVHPNLRVSYRISAKGYREEWTERAVIVADSVLINTLPRQPEDVLALMIQILQEQMLPPSRDI